MDEDAADTIAELRAVARFERRRMLAYLAHPDPRDPDYPHEYEQEDEE